MKVLTIIQPWAWLIAAGHKDIENRSWDTKFRGRFLIHAGRGVDVAGFALAARLGIEVPLLLPAGGIIGEAELCDVVKHSDSPRFRARL